MKNSLNFVNTCLSVVDTHRYVSEGNQRKEIYRDTGCGEPYGSASFVTENLIVVRSCNKLSLVDADGNVSFSTTYARQYDLQTFDSSADGKRFAIAVAELKKEPFWTGDPGYDDVHPTLIVFDTKTHKSVSSFVLNQKYERPFSFALSADGSQMALFRNGVLELYRIEAEQK